MISSHLMTVYVKFCQKSNICHLASFQVKQCHGLRELPCIHCLLIVYHCAFVNVYQLFSEFLLAILDSKLETIRPVVRFFLNLNSSM